MDENEKFIGFIANSYEFRSEALQSPAVTVQNAVGPTPLRLLMLSQKPSLLGFPIKRYFSYFEPDADIKRRLLIMKQRCEAAVSLKKKTNHENSELRFSIISDLQLGKGSAISL